jgi:Glycosyl hydrolases family 2, sugar binding domain/Glycosyl hydrolases family 2, TIM barrel domain
MAPLACAWLLSTTLLVACTPATRGGSLPPTLTMEDAAGGQVAMQNGIPVPTFDAQPRPHLDLSGTWRVERAVFDSELSLTDRKQALDPITAQAAGREAPGYDDSGWETIPVPGTVNPPPKRETGAWYRHTFEVPAAWDGLAVTLKFAAVNYVADVWVNGTYLGYHEGGYTPFAFDVTRAVHPGESNLIAVRVDNPAWGTRNDIVPWGLADWWNYGGITRPVWLEAGDSVQVARADVVPHLDGADVALVLWNAGHTTTDATPTPTSSPTPSPTEPATTFAPSQPAGSPAVPGTASVLPTPTPGIPRGTVRMHVEVLPARVTPDNVTDPDVRLLMPGRPAPLATADLSVAQPGPGDAGTAHVAFLFGGAEPWSPGFPALYVLHVVITTADGLHDELWTSFGLRRVSVDPKASRVLLNGKAVFFRGVGLHDEEIVPGTDAQPVTGHRISLANELLAQLDDARTVGADLIRSGHTPANPLLLMLADRLGFAVWEEIPLYHDTPLTFGVSMDRGIPQQMLREMDLRDFNRPSVLFHGLANESVGGTERERALATLAGIDRSLDGTRLLGQAAYGSQPTDTTQAPLDVAGFTFYYGVFYGSSPATDTATALAAAHRANPGKPIIALEFGRWSSGADGPSAQRRILSSTYPEFSRRSDVLSDGYVAGAVWWTLEDFLTERPGITVESFGLFTPQGSARPAASVAAHLFGLGSGRGAQQQIESTITRGAATAQTLDPFRDWRLIGYLAYALALSLVALGLLVLVLSHRGGRAVTGPRS